MTGMAASLATETVACNPVVPSCVGDRQACATIQAEKITTRIVGCKVLFTNKTRVDAAELT